MKRKREDHDNRMLPIYDLIMKVKSKDLKDLIDSGQSPKVDNRLIIGYKGGSPLFLSEYFFGQNTRIERLFNHQLRSLGALLIPEFMSTDLNFFTQFLVLHWMPNTFGANPEDFEIFSKIVANKHHNPLLYLEPGQKTFSEHYYEATDSEDKFLTVKHIQISMSIFGEMKIYLVFKDSRRLLPNDKYQIKAQLKGGPKTRALLRFVNKYNSESNDEFELETFIREEAALFELIPVVYTFQLGSGSFLEYISEMPQNMGPALIHVLGLRFGLQDREMLLSLFKNLILNEKLDTLTDTLKFIMMGSSPFNAGEITELLDYALNFMHYCPAALIAKWYLIHPKISMERRQTLMEQTKDWLTMLEDDPKLLRLIYQLALDHHYLDYAFDLVDRMKLSENESLGLKFPVYLTVFISAGGDANKKALLDCFETMTGLRSDEFQPLFNILTDPLPSNLRRRIRSGYWAAQSTGQPILPALFQAYKPTTEEKAVQTEETAPIKQVFEFD